jgi:hypothetical protein
LLVDPDVFWVYTHSVVLLLLFWFVCFWGFLAALGFEVIYHMSYSPSLLWL